MKRAFKRTIIGIALLGIGFHWLAPWCLPWPDGLKMELDPVPTFQDRHGKPLRRMLPDDGRRLSVVAYAAIPRALVEATVSAEDKRFFKHGGIDHLAILRAIGDGARQRSIVSGASTITQQLVKISSDYADERRTWSRKVRELLLARRLEMTWSKEAILQAYLNRLDYGNLHRGCASAAHGYFGKPLVDLSVAEAAFLAGLPQSPSRLNPYRHPARARARQRLVLDRWEKCYPHRVGAVQRARDEALRLQPRMQVFEAPHLIEHLLQLDTLPQRTTIDLEIQGAAEQALRGHLEGFADDRLHGSVIVMDTTSSEVLALVGSRDFGCAHGGQVNGAFTPRSPGSALKPFTYALALERDYTPSTILADIPTEYVTPTGLYQPENYHRHHAGPILLREALATSLNVPAVRVLQDLGGSEVLLEALHALGITSLDRPSAHYGLGLTIGNAPVSLIELTNAYSCLARMGETRPYRLLANAPAGITDRLLRPQTCYVLAEILSDDVARAGEFGRHSQLHFSYPVACKTGTSSAYRDAWAFGYTPRFTVGVWVGRMDGRPMDRITGIRGAAPVMHTVMDHLHESTRSREFVRPNGVLSVMVDRRTGNVLDGELRQRHRAQAVETLVSVSQPAPQAKATDYDHAGRVLLDAAFAGWLENQPAGTRKLYAIASASKNTPLTITFPQPGTIICLDPMLPSEGRHLMLHAHSHRPLRWHSDTLSLTQYRGRSEAWLEPGRHEIMVQAEGSTERATTWIMVRRL